MSKSILIIDTPKSCIECDVFDHEQLCCLGCKVNFGELSKVQSWCPLKPLPQKIDISEDELYEKQYMCFEGGWNACIDEILGE